MAKPAITKRTVKGAALSYSELDTNFQNLADATVTLTGGSTAVTADLNGNITLVAGSNVTITGNNTAKTITIASSGGGLSIDPSSGDYELAADIDTNNYFILNSGGNIKVGDDVLFPADSGPLVSGSGTLLCRGGTIKLQYTNDPGLELAGATLSTPSNTTTPTHWLKITVNGSTRYIALYT